MVLDRLGCVCVYHTIQCVIVMKGILYPSCKIRFLLIALYAYIYINKLIPKKIYIQSILDLTRVVGRP